MAVMSKRRANPGYFLIAGVVVLHSVPHVPVPGAVLFLKICMLRDQEQTTPAFAADGRTDQRLRLAHVACEYLHRTVGVSLLGVSVRVRRHDTADDWRVL
jgi:hypothetical protein